MTPYEFTDWLANSQPVTIAFEAQNMRHNDNKGCLPARPENSEAWALVTL